MKLTANGIATNYSLEGPAGAPVVTLSHSLAANVSMWDPQMADLTRRWRVLRYDTRGHGATEVPAGAYSLEQMAGDVLGLLDALDIRTTHWVGLSMGGMIGQTLALQAPERLAGLVLCDTSSRTPPEGRALWADRIKAAQSQGMEPLVEPTIGRWFTPGFVKSRSDVVDRVRAMIRGTNPQGYIGCGHAIAALDLTDQLPAIRLRTLVVVGEEEPGTPVAAARVIHERIKGSALTILPSASHLSNMEQPEAFSRAVTEFLAGL